MNLKYSKLTAPLLNPLKELNFAGRWNSIKGYLTLYYESDETFQVKSTLPLEPVGAK